MKDYSNSKIPRLFELMDERNIKAKDITLATGITAASFTDWKNKGNLPSPQKLQLLSDFFNVSVEYLLGNDSEANALDMKIQIQVSQLSDEQKLDVLKYIKFVRSAEEA